MRWLRTGRQIGQAVKNVARLRQIVSVLAKNGFVDLVDRMHLSRFMVGRLRAFAESQADRSPAERLRTSLEELGPTFVKLGQILSTRPDLLPESFIEELTKLQDSAQMIPFEVVRESVERELKGSIDSLYASFESAPLASASIAQVHNATLKTGEKVVVKVQRPDIERLIQTDVSLLKLIAGLLEKYVPEARVANPKVFVDEFFRTITSELDFILEANNMSRIAENMATIPEIVIPKVYRRLSTRRVLTLERLEGIRVNDLKSLDAAGVDKKLIVQIGSRAFFRSVLVDGLFHGDLHGGNLFVLPGNRLGLIDFGIVGRLSEKSRDQLANMVMALLNEDFEQLCFQYAELGAAEPSIDFDAFIRDTRNTLSPYLGLPLNQLNMGRVLIEATKVAARYKVKVPGDWMIVFKAILTTEGMGRSLDPEFDIMASGRELVSELIRNQYSFARISKDLLWVAKDLGALAQSLPRQIRWMLRKFNSNGFAFEIKVPELESLKEQLNSNARRTTHGVLAAGLLIAGSIALQDAHSARFHDYPVPAVVLFGLGALFALRLLR